MSEKIRWSFSFWLIALLFNLLLAITIWGVLDTSRTFLVALASFSLTILVGHRSSYVVSIDENVLRVGKAWIDRKFIGTALPLNREEMRRARGIELNPSAYVELRGWISTGVKIEINDPEDPTPYWLISSKQYKELTSAINKKSV